ncbi:polysaccharide deacetylase family protein [bacterium]|nr:polysaccharide deacetylase family protein [bacterium]
MKGLLIFLGLTMAALARPARDLPVLCYHQVAEPRMGDDMIIGPETFEAHLRYLQEQGYHSVTLKQAQQFLWGRGDLPGRSVLITFDDGYDGVYREAMPLLRKYKQRAVVFLVVGHIGDRRAATPHLDLKQLKEMRDSGLFEFGSHTYDLHVLIPERLAARRIFPSQILADLKKSRSELKRLLNVDVQALAWPYSHYSRACTQLAARAGFRCQFTTDYGRNRPFQGSARIRRIRVSANSNDVTTLEWKLQHPELSNRP